MTAVNCKVTIFRSCIFVHWFVLFIFALSYISTTLTLYRLLHLTKFWFKFLLIEAESVHQTSVCLTFILYVCLLFVASYRKNLLVKCELFLPSVCRVFLVQSCWGSWGGGRRSRGATAELSFIFDLFSGCSEVHCFVVMHLLMWLYQLRLILWVNALMGHLFKQRPSIREWSMQFIYKVCVCTIKG